MALDPSLDADDSSAADATKAFNRVDEIEMTRLALVDMMKEIDTTNKRVGKSQRIAKTIVSMFGPGKLDDLRDEDITRVAHIARMVQRAHEDGRKAM